MFKQPLDLSSIIRKIKLITDGNTEYYKSMADDAEEVETLNNVDIVSYLIGVTIGTHINLPPTEVPLPTAWFSLNYGKEVRKFISDINEAAMINVSQAYSAAANMFEMRYNICYNRNMTLEDITSLGYGQKTQPANRYLRELSNFSDNNELKALFNSLNTELNLKKDKSGGA